MAFLNRYFFNPDREVRNTPADQGLSFEETYFSSQDGMRLHGWYVPGEGDVTWIWLHGNAGNIGHRVEDILLYHRHLGVNIFLFDYRGYGNSEGTPTEKGLYLDAAASLSYVLSRPEAERRRIIYFGRSLGGAVAVELATHHPPAGLILESTFASAGDMARHHVPRLPIHFLVKGKFNSIDRIRRVSCPLLVIHGTHDELVPFSQGRKLFDAARGPKRWLEVSGGDHSDTHIVAQEVYLASLREFLTSLPVPTP